MAIKQDEWYQLSTVALITLSLSRRFLCGPDGADSATLTTSDDHGAYFTFQNDATLFSYFERRREFPAAHDREAAAIWGLLLVSVC